MSGSFPIVEVQNTHSGRARCKYHMCLEQIGPDCPRVLVPMFSQGRMMQASTHLDCFIRKCLCVEIADRGNVGKCKKTGKKLEKGEFRAAVRVGNTAKYNLSLQAAVDLLGPILAQGGMSGAEVEGADKLPAGEAANKWKACGGKGGAKTKSSPMKKAVAEAKAKAAPAKGEKAEKGEKKSPLSMKKSSPKSKLPVKKPMGKKLK